MEDNTRPIIVKDNSPLSENSIDVAGYKAIDNPFSLPGFQSKRSLEDYDRVSLTKLQYTGFPVTSLSQAHNNYHISPIRSVQDLWRILGYERNPQGRSHTSPRYNEDHVAALAIQYPNLQFPGEVYNYNRLIRVRPRQTIVVKTKGETENRKYEQPRATEQTSTSEPYFLVQKEMWAKIYDTSLPLLITEGELKAAALGMAGYAAIGFGGITMWRAPKKAGKDRLHETLDPKTPWAIPIQDRQVILVPDVDYHTNQAISRECHTFGRMLLMAGSSPPKVMLMSRPRNNEWKGIDDYITWNLGPMWAGEPSLVDKANKLIANIIESQYEIIREDGHYNPTDSTRCKNRILAKLSHPNRFTVVMTAQSHYNNETVGWAMYNHDNYNLERINFTGGTSGKMTTASPKLRKLVEDDYEEAVVLQAMEGATPKGGPRGMPVDHPNTVLAKVDTELPRMQDNTLIEPFPGVNPGDKCLRITGALINLTKCFELKMSWDRRVEWLLPPDYRWFSLGALNVSLSNIVEPPTCPLFLEFLNNAFEGNEEKIDCLQLWFGKIITSPMFFDLQQFLCFYGTAGSGKSTITNILTELLGPSEVENIRADFGGRFDLGGLIGKKLVVFSEAQDGSDNAMPQSLTNAIKGITGGDLTTIERKRQDPISTKLKTEILLVSNNPPEMHMDPDAFIRRAVFLSTTKKIDNPSPQRRASMMLELPGILMWALKGAAILAYDPEPHIETPGACMADLNDAISDVSPEASFVRLRVVKATTPDAILTRDQLEEAFQDWLNETARRGYVSKPKRLVRLVREVHKVGIENVRDKKNQSKLIRAFKGLRIAEQNQQV